jgi:hypothetical protein
MFEAEFTHEGELCTFEVLQRRFLSDDKALQALAEIVHDIDVKEDKYSRPEKSGVEAFVSGLVSVGASDEIRLTQSSTFFDALYSFFQGA